MLELLANTEAISGGAGWVGAGLLGAVLAWLLMKHLPDKDRQVEMLITRAREAMEVKDNRIIALIESQDKVILSMSNAHVATTELTMKNCREEAAREREASERRYGAAIAALERHHSEVMTAQQRLYESSREGVHMMRNMAQRTRWADALQSAELPAWTKGLDGTLMSWNFAAEQVLGWKQGEVVGKPVYNFLIPRNRSDQEREVLKRIGNGETVEEYETERLTRDGRTVTLMVVTSPIRDQSGKVIGASTIAREV
jgi:PAS domain S-box-containing protein